jgi:hypothetical protein
MEKVKSVMRPLGDERTDAFQNLDFFVHCFCLRFGVCVVCYLETESILADMPTGFRIC